MLKYCSNCGAKNEFRFLEGRKRYVCPACGAIHYENPRPAVTVIAVENGSIVLVKRAVEPAKGKWCLPGGFMEMQESAAQAAHRELEEETGLTAQDLAFLGLCPFPGGILGDLLVLGFVTDHFEGRLAPGDDASEAQFFPLEKLPRIVFRCHRQIVRMYKDLTQPDL